MFKHCFSFVRRKKMFSSSPFALLDMPLLNVERGRNTFLMAPHPQPSPMKADGGWQGGTLDLLICWEAGQGSLRVDTPQQEESDLVAGESDFGLPLLLSLPPTLLEWIHESVQSIPSLFISDFLTSVNEIQPFSPLLALLVSGAQHPWSLQKG